MAKILLTGAAGFIGSHVCEALLRTDNEVAAVDNFDDFYSADVKRQNISTCQDRPGFQLFTLDVRNGADVDSLFCSQRFDAVIHLAARPGVRDSITNPRVYLDININGTLNVLEAMKKHRVGKLVFASSSSVYGGIAEIPFRESQPVIPICPYAATKAAGEALCSAYSKTTGISATCCRFFTVYGPRQRPDMAITRFAKAMVNGQTITVFGDGSSTRDYTFVEDIVTGVLAALASDRGFDVFNLGSTLPIRLSEVIDLLGGNLCVVPKITFSPLQPGEPPSTLADISKAQSLLGYRPRTEFRTGIERFVHWYENQPDFLTARTKRFACAV